MKKIIAKIGKSVVPTKTVEESKKQIAEIAFNLVKKEIKKFPEVMGLEFGGSFAKGTWLSKDADIDIFLRFVSSTSKERFEKIAKKIGFESLKKYKPYVRYSEHPYVEAKIKNTKINIVPFYDVKIGNWQSSTDRSTFHTKFMKKSLTLKMRNEVRILKTFLQSNGIYGAEIAKQGFSGYVSEVLILHFKSFEKVIKTISEVRENTIIGKTTKKFDTSIVIIDPVDKNRNLAAAISDESLGKFILTSRAFKEKPNLEFFKNKKSRILRKYSENLLVVKFEFKIRSPDIIWGQIKRATSSLSTQLELEGFNVLQSRPYTDQQKEAYLFFLLESTEISSIYQKNGPEFFRQGSSKEYISQNLRDLKLMWIGENRKILSLEKRRHADAAKFMREFLGNNFRTGIPKGLSNDFKRGFKVSIGTKNLSKSIKEAANELISTDGAFLHFD